MAKERKPPTSPSDLTNQGINALRKKPAGAGETYDVMDAQVRGFGVRVNERAVLTYFLNARYPGSANPARRAIGRHGETTLADARDKAREWKDLIARGLNPREEADRARLEQARRRSNTFAAVAEDFIASLPATERKRSEVARDIRRELIPALGMKPVADIRPRDLIEVVNTIMGRGAPHQARNVLGHARRLFGWAIAQDAYGLEHSPCASIQPRKVIGKKVRRKRVLDDDELRAVWRAVDRLQARQHNSHEALPTGYPYAAVFRLLLLTGARRSEIAHARWSEIDMAQRALIIPPARHKSDEGHVIPLCDDAMAIIDSLPRFKGGDYLFSATNGVKPIGGFSINKERLDRRMLRTWRALGRRAGTDRRTATVAPWVIHDLRRTVRTRLSELVPQDIAERIIGHAQGELIRTYDLFAYLEQKRDGLRLWQDRLRGILSPSPGPAADGGNVIPWAKRVSAG